MRFLAGFILLILTGLLAGCGESPEDKPLRLRHPSPTVGAALLPTLPPLPTTVALPAAMPLPTVAPLPAATVAPPVTLLPTATELPAATLLPTVAPLPAATAAPAVTPLPTVAELPAATPTPDLDLPVVTIGGGSWPVELAVTAEQQTQGLSGRAELAAGSGMLFVWAGESRRSFWMPDMNFPLDLVWIDGDCAVVAITRDAPPQRPGQSRAELPRYVVEGVQYVLEINAGEAALRGVKVGDGVVFGEECGG